MFSIAEIETFDGFKVTILIYKNLLWGYYTFANDETLAYIGERVDCITYGMNVRTGELDFNVYYETLNVLTELAKIFNKSTCSVQVASSSATMSIYIDIPTMAGWLKQYQPEILSSLLFVGQKHIRQAFAKYIERDVSLNKQ